MAEVAISVRNVSKRYRVFESQRARLLHAIWRQHSAGMQEIEALSGITFDVERGESLAIIGRNGGGKSTLLQILTGMLVPTTGEATLKGRVSALLELGSGFNPEYTGRDNVVLNGLLLGLSREEIVGRFREIVAFAEIGDAMERPVKTYSTGMLMRLAFAVQVLTEPEILVIDEALSVGDFFFQQKCLSYIRGLCEKGVTLVFVSHDMGTVRDLCRRAIYLREGQLRFQGDTRLAIKHYLAEREWSGPADVAPMAAAESTQPGEFESILQESIWRAPPAAAGEGRGRLIAVALYDEEGHPATSFVLGSTVRVKVAYRPDPEQPTHVVLVLLNKYGQVVSSLGSSRLGLTPPSADGAAPVIFETRIHLMLEAGNYSITASLGHQTGPNHGDNIDTSGPIGPISVRWDYDKDPAPFLGMCGLPAEGEFRTVTARVAA